MIGPVLAMIVFLILIALFYYVITALPLPDPLKRIATVVLVVCAALILMGMLLPFTGIDPGWRVIGAR